MVTNYMRKKDRRISKKKDQYLQSEKRPRSKTNNCSIFSILLFSLLLSFLSIKSTCNRVVTEIRESLPIAQSPRLMNVEGADKWNNIYYVNRDEQWAEGLPNGSRQVRIEIEVLSWAGLNRFANGKNMLHERYVDNDKTIHVRTVENQAPQEDCLSSVEELNNCWRKIVEEYTFLPGAEGKRVTLKYESIGKGGDKKSLSIILQWAPPPIIKEFKVSRNSVCAPDNVIFSWIVDDSEERPVKTVKLDGAVVNKVGEKRLNVEAEGKTYKDFTLIAEGPADQTRRSCRVDVYYIKISEFSVSPKTLCRNYGDQKVQVNWKIDKLRPGGLREIRWGLMYGDGKIEYAPWAGLGSDNGQWEITLQGNQITNADKVRVEISVGSGSCRHDTWRSSDLIDCEEKKTMYLYCVGSGCDEKILEGPAYYKGTYSIPQGWEIKKVKNVSREFTLHITEGGYIRPDEYTNRWNSRTGTLKMECYIECTPLIGRECFGRGGGYPPYNLKLEITLQSK